MPSINNDASIRHFNTMYGMISKRQIDTSTPFGYLFSLIKVPFQIEIELLNNNFNLNPGIMDPLRPANTQDIMLRFTNGVPKYNSFGIDSPEFKILTVYEQTYKIFLENIKDSIFRWESLINTVENLNFDSIEFENAYADLLAAKLDLEAKIKIAECYRTLFPNVDHPGDQDNFIETYLDLYGYYYIDDDFNNLISRIRNHRS